MEDGISQEFTIGTIVRSRELLSIGSNRHM